MYSAPACYSRAEKMWVIEACPDFNRSTYLRMVEPYGVRCRIGLNPGLEYGIRKSTARTGEGTTLKSTAKAHSNTHGGLARLTWSVALCAQYHVASLRPTPASGPEKCSGIPRATSARIWRGWNDGQYTAIPSCLPDPPLAYPSGRVGTVGRLRTADLLSPRWSPREGADLLRSAPGECLNGPRVRYVFLKSLGMGGQSTVGSWSDADVSESVCAETQRVREKKYD
ncbi:hypothetical protein C8R47DRAFT_365012 [Mycena vitilis]|nr:hypothetical protein C8R47DRAFT_365012 [Mycena vitilis]